MCLVSPSNRGKAGSPSWAEAAEACSSRVADLEAVRILSSNLRPHILEALLEAARTLSSGLRPHILEALLGVAGTSR